MTETIPQADLAKSQTRLHDALVKARLWQFASFSDAFVRRAIYQLLVVSLAKRKTDLDPPTISANVLTSALHSSQMGSAYDYAGAIALLTAEMPSVWIQDYQGTGKKSATSRLCYFLRKGSQGGPPQFWAYIEKLMRHLPKDVLFRKRVDGTDDKPSMQMQSFSEVLDAFHDGVVNKDEPRTNSEAAWSSYLAASVVIFELLPMASLQTELLKSFVLPILSNYLEPSLDNNGWAIAGQQQHDICVKAFLQVSNQDESLLIDRWREISARIIEDFKTSLPEQSKDYTKSQDSLAAATRRWYGMQAAIMKKTSSPLLLDVFSQTLDSELEAAISTLKARNGKPYGIAAAIDIAVQLLAGPLLLKDPIKTRLYMFANYDVPSLLISQSAKHLVHTMDLLQWTCDVRQGFTDCAKALAESPESTQKRAAVQALLSSPSLASNECLLSMAKNSLEEALDKDNAADWDLVMAFASNSEAPIDLTSYMLAKLTEGLSLDLQKRSSLHGLELLQQRNMGLMIEYSAKPEGEALIARLMHLSEGLDNPRTAIAKSLSKALQDVLVASNDPHQATRYLLSHVKHSFDEPNAESLS